MVVMRTRNLNRSVVLLRRGAGVDDGLTIVPGDWAELATRFASVKPKIGREPVLAGERAGEAVQSVWMRRDEVTETLTERDAVEIDGQRHEIVAPPIEVGFREGIELLVVRGGPGE